MFEFVIPTGDITKFMSMKNAPKLNFSIKASATGGAGSYSF